MPKTILLVEDDEDILELLYFVLTDERYEVVRSKGDDAFQQALARQPFLILLDHRLEGSWGSRICAELKADNRTKHIPVVMMSAAIDLEQTAELAGADGALKKPFDLEELLELVRKYQ